MSGKRNFSSPIKHLPWNGYPAKYGVGSNDLIVIVIINFIQNFQVILFFGIAFWNLFLNFYFTFHIEFYFLFFKSQKFILFFFFNFKNFLLLPKIKKNSLKDLQQVVTRFQLQLSIQETRLISSWFFFLASLILCLLC